MSEQKDYTIVTCCNRVPMESYYCFNEYFKSLGDYRAVVLTEEFGGRWTGLGSKPKWLLKALKEGHIITPYILFTDCWDFVFAKSPDTLIDRYVHDFKDYDLVISSERNCFPADLKEQYDALPHTSSYRYLNSGMIIGKTEALRKTLEAMDLDNVPDDYRRADGGMEHINDQFLWQQIFLMQPVKMQLDYNQVLCQTLHDVTPEHLDFTGEKIRNIETGSYPLSLHMNGSGKTNGCREPILKHLNLL